jgi:hypothetical protein
MDIYTFGVDLFHGSTLASFKARLDGRAIKASKAFRA